MSEHLLEAVQHSLDAHPEELANIAKQAKTGLQTDTLEAVISRGYFSGAEILACREAGITVTLPQPLTSDAQGGRTLR
ncbi:hypothetical protein [Bradyrhizobium sp. BR 1433]|uniref:hypothetical protein n=1 Tax=Bradyrhizobium sp. BR 1433 TaxID=3447967 RepID=UPI003EE5889D